MEELLYLTHSEHEVLHKYKRKLESRYRVKLLMPEIKNSDLCGVGEVFFINIIGDSQNIEFVKRFLKHKLDAKKSVEKRKSDESIIILNSDSENDSNVKTVVTKKKIKGSRHKKQNNKSPIIDLESSPVTLDKSIILCDEVSSTTNEENDSVIIINDPPAEDFIPIIAKNTSKASCSRSMKNNSNVEVIELLSDEEDAIDVEDAPVVIKESEHIPKSISIDTKRLRPVVIDGSNVARLHGKPQNTFSSKGIKICIEYFLKRGHPSVTAFVPLFRKHCFKGPFPTSDPEILEELEQTQHVVFTPSRRLEKNSFACYDDRFIVELAVSNGGVILSNDNYKDLIDTSPAFKETITKRLLMFCFVGDLLMIPNDPLGSKGPTLEEFLSFPPTSDT